MIYLSQGPLNEPVPIETNTLVNWVQVSRAVINSLILIVLVASVIGLIYGGYQYITSQGNPDAIKSAKMTLLASIIAVVLSVSAYAVVAFVINNVFG